MATKTYTISRRTEAFSWDAVPALQVNTFLWTPCLPISAQAQLCYDDDALYVHMRAVEQNIRAEEQGPTAFPHWDSCLEFFFSPDPEDSRYFNFEFNPLCCPNVGFGYDRYEHIRLIKKAEHFQAKANYTDDGWEIFYQIPYSLIRIFFPGFSPTSGDRMRANFYKCGEKTAQLHYISWNPVELEKPDFHRPEFFGTLYFE